MWSIEIGACTNSSLFYYQNVLLCYSYFQTQVLVYSMLYVICTWSLNMKFIIMHFTTFIWFQKLINHQWVGLEAADKMEIRTVLNTFLLEKHNSLESFLRNKLVKLVVDIGRLDWPHFYPDFFSSILQVIVICVIPSLSVCLCLSVLLLVFCNHSSSYSLFQLHCSFLCYQPNL